MKPVFAPQPELRRLRRDLSMAADEQIARVVAMLDRLPDRGEADQVLDPLRPRLRTLKPPRPLTLARLLFMPLEGALVAPTAWRRGGPVAAGPQLPESGLAGHAARAALRQLLQSAGGAGLGGRGLAGGRGQGAASGDVASRP